MGRRGPCAFRQCDVERAIKAARAAGLEVTRIEIDREGNIAIETGPADAARNGTQEKPEDLKKLI
jgi:hypothetical protein